MTWAHIGLVALLCVSLTGCAATRQEAVTREVQSQLALTKNTLDEAQAEVVTLTRQRDTLRVQLDALLNAEPPPWPVLRPCAERDTPVFARDSHLSGVTR